MVVGQTHPLEVALQHGERSDGSPESGAVARAIPQPNLLARLAGDLRHAGPSTWPEPYATPRLISNLLPYMESEQTPQRILRGVKNVFASMAFWKGAPEFLRENSIAIIGGTIFVGGVAVATRSARFAAWLQSKYALALGIGTSQTFVAVSFDEWFWAAWNAKTPEDISHAQKLAAAVVLGTGATGLQFRSMGRSATSGLSPTASKGAETDEMAGIPNFGGAASDSPAIDPLAKSLASLGAQELRGVLTASVGSWPTNPRHRAGKIIAFINQELAKHAIPPVKVEIVESEVAAESVNFAKHYLFSAKDWRVTLYSNALPDSLTQPEIRNLELQGGLVYLLTRIEQANTALLRDGMFRDMGNAHEAESAAHAAMAKYRDYLFKRQRLPITEF